MARRIRLGMEGGGEGAIIGGVHRMAAGQGQGLAINGPGEFSIGDDRACERYCTNEHTNDDNDKVNSHREPVLLFDVLCDAAKKHA